MRIIQAGNGFYFIFLAKDVALEKCFDISYLLRKVRAR